MNPDPVTDIRSKLHFGPIFRNMNKQMPIQAQTLTCRNLFPFLSGFVLGVYFYLLVWLKQSVEGSCMQPAVIIVIKVLTYTLILAAYGKGVRKPLNLIRTAERT